MSFPLFPGNTETTFGCHLKMELPNETFPKMSLGHSSVSLHQLHFEELSTQSWAILPISTKMLKSLSFTSYFILHTINQCKKNSISAQQLYAAVPEPSQIFFSFVILFENP